MRVWIILWALLLVAACTTNTRPMPTSAPTAAEPPITPRATATPEEDVTSPTQSTSALALFPDVTRISECPNAPPIRMIVQERGQVIASGDDRSLNLRRGPGTNYEVIVRLEPGETFIVLDGPACSQLYTWFYIRYDQEEIFYEGWIAEGDDEQYYAAPYLPG